MRRDRLAGERLARREVLDAASRRVEADRIPRVDAPRLRASEREQADVEAVAVEEAGEARRDHRGDAERLERSGGLLARRARPEVAAADDYVPLAHAGRKSGIDHLEAVFRDLLDAELHVLSRRQDVGVQVVAVDPRAAAHRSSRGSVMQPVTAAAATV